MKRYFNIEGSCHGDEHYMVDLEKRLDEIKTMVDRKKYFSINCSRQFGKTTTLQALTQRLKKEYIVISLDFQMLCHDDFKSESTFVSAFSREILMATSEPESIPEDVIEKLTAFSEETCANRKLSFLFLQLSNWCKLSKKPVILIIDEVDSATNNQVFLDLLSQLRGYYIHRRNRPTFQSVILAGVYDVKNLKQKIRSDEEHKRNSPWNISAKFEIDMSFSAEAIGKMLQDYEQDYHTGMNTAKIANLIYDYTSGYPFLVSNLCKIMDEQIAGSEEFPQRKDAWTKAGFLEAIKIILSEKNTLFESMINKLRDYPILKRMIYEILFQGASIPYNADDYTTDIGMMFGFLKNENSTVKIANRIFETRFYNFFLAEGRTQEPEIIILKPKPVILDEPM